MSKYNPNPNPNPNPNKATTPEKNREYVKKFSQDKIRACLYLEPRLVADIDKLKQPDESYAGWIKSQITVLVQARLKKFSQNKS